jgi:hypothetical protein
MFERSEFADFSKLSLLQERWKTGRNLLLAFWAIPTVKSVYKIEFA